MTIGLLLLLLFAAWVVKCITALHGRLSDVERALEHDLERRDEIT